jgi:hypothetical protein
MNSIKWFLILILLGSFGVIRAQVSKSVSNEVDLSVFAPKKEELVDSSKFESQEKIIEVPTTKDFGLFSDVDLDIPQTSIQNSDAIAVIIGNRDYQRTKNVDYAIHDARAMKMYLKQAFGFKEGNIFYVENATKTDFEILFGNKDSFKGKLFNAVKPEISDVFIYYSGHGAPDLEKFTGYFVPVDSDPSYIAITGYNSEVFYENLSKVPAKNITVVLDACFSGANILEGISPVGIKPKKFNTIQNGVLLSSSSGTQVSSWYEEQNHGMFTYFFLKAIQDANADANKDSMLTAQEIFNYVSDLTEGVPYYARRFRNVDQNPTLQGSKKDFVLLRYQNQ